MKLSNETKVGALVLGTIGLAIVFAWVIGIQNPFKRSVEFYLTYHFAGGIEVGSPVRVSGIKVGKVEEIDFFVPASPENSTESLSLKEPGSAETQETQKLMPVRLKISVLDKAAVGIRQDSRFYINLAGIIGERYIEITPGSMDKPAIQSGQVIAGVDPPRIDQLISQSFDLAGKVTDFVEKNKGDITKTINTLYKLSVNVNRTVVSLEKSKIFKSDLSQLVDNLIQITASMKKLTNKIETKEGRQTLDLLYKLLWRLEPLDSKNIKSFLQKEGIRARIF